MRLRTAVLAGAVTLVGLGGFLLLQTTSVTDDGVVSVGKVPTASAHCKDEPDCRPPLGRLRTVAGPELTDEALEGKVVMVNFWAPWCGPCVEEMPALEAVYRRHIADLVILGIAIDEPSDEAAMAFAQQRGVSYPNVRITPALERVLGRPGLIPTSIIYDRSGKQVATFSHGISERDLEAQLAPLFR